MLSFNNLLIARKNTELIASFSAKIENGNFVILTGANGAGKSTFLKTLAGLIPITNGEILIDGIPVMSYSHHQRSRLVAYADSKKIEEDYIRIIDLVKLGRYPYLSVRIEIKVQNALIEFYMKELGILAIKDKFLNEISDGELQKANIARALVQDTPVIVMDEPTAFLDYPSKRQLFSLLRDLAKERNKIIICATHDVDLASGYGSKFWHLEDKKLQFSDKPVEWKISGN